MAAASTSEYKWFSMGGWQKTGIVSIALLALSLLVLSVLPIAQAVDYAGVHYAPPRNDLYGGNWRERWRHTPDCRKEDGCLIEFDERASVIFLRYKWANLNPAPDTFNFEHVGQAVDDIVAAGKKVSLVVAAGKYTPPWVFEAGALHHDVDVLVFDKERQNKSAQPHIPAPWDKTFLAAYDRLIMRLSAFLKEKPERYEAIALVKLGGINVHSPEIRLNAPKAFNLGNDRKAPENRARTRKRLCHAWARIGYSEEKVLSAAASLTASIDRAFPDKALGLGYVIGSNRFPTIDPVTGECNIEKKNGTMENIIKQMVRDYGERAVPNSTVLWGEGGNPPINRWIKNQGSKIGFQLNRQAVGCKNDQAPCNEGEFIAAMEHGLRADAVFIEVHNGNIHRHRKLLAKYDKLMREAHTESPGFTESLLRFFDWE